MQEKERFDYYTSKWTLIEKSLKSVEEITYNQVDFNFLEETLTGFSETLFDLTMEYDLKPDRYELKGYCTSF